MKFVTEVVTYEHRWYVELGLVWDEFGPRYKEEFGVFETEDDGARALAEAGFTRFHNEWINKQSKFARIVRRQCPVKSEII
jgi:hypothetical protein